jgi:hypothetical protein
VRGRLAVPALPLASAAPAAGVAAAVSTLGLLHGGFDRTTWSGATVVSLGAACVVLRRPRRVELGRAGAVQLALLAAFVAWTAVECLGPGAATRGVPAVQLGVLYLSALWVALLVVRRTGAACALLGLLGGIVFVLGKGLAAELLPHTVRVDALEGRLLFEPVGYANGCGVLAALGVVVGLGLAAHASASGVRAAAACALVPLGAALELTGSRGAVLAAGAGLAVGLLLDPGRRRLAEVALVTLPLPVAGAWLASLSRVTDAHLTTSVIARNGKIVAVALVALAVAQAALAGRVLPLCRGSRPLALRLVAGLGAVACILVAVHAGSALGDRPAYWRVAWADARARPFLGSGPGSFGAAWLELRPGATSVQNAHNLYLETLAELGPLGLALLVAALGVPLAALRGRRDSLAAVAAAGYAVFLVHAGLDWDWQLPVVTVAALVCGAVAVVRSRGARGGLARPRIRRAALVASAVLAALASVAFAGDRTLVAAGRAAQSGRLPAAVRLGEAAQRRQPWSAAPSRFLGETYLALGDRPAALRAFERATALDPGDWRGWYGVARAAGGAARRRALERVLRLDPLAVRRVSP